MDAETFTIRHFIRNVGWTVRDLQLFENLSGKIAYLPCRWSTDSEELIELRVRGVPVPLLCRPGTSDPAVLWDTFGLKYHRPTVTLRERPVILDLGANVGYTTVDFAVRYPRARIIAVELDESNFQVAKRNIHPFGVRCDVIHAAVWRTSGQVSYTGKSAWALHIVSGQDNDENNAFQMVAPAITMQTIFEQYNIEKADFVKMDIEGAESEVLRVETEWLTRVGALKIEIHPPATLESCSSMLKRAGFAVERDLRHPCCLQATNNRA